MASDISLLADVADTADTTGQRSRPRRRGKQAYWISKRALDVVLSLLALPVLLVVALILLVLNPFYNKGPLIFRQERLGRRTRPFITLKFRTMTATEVIERGEEGPLEHDRITPLGRILRKSRLDELPQFINILRGEMSVVGPRPDYAPHARAFIEKIPEYRARHAVRPGLSGLAQVTLGYVEGVEETRFKAQADLAYIRNASFLLDMKILWLTLLTIVSFRGR